MQTFDYYAPTKIVFGKDTEKRTGELAKEWGAKKVFVVYGGKSAVKSGLLEKVSKSLTAEGIKVRMTGGIVPNPLLSKARELIKEAIDFNADFIIAVGGGSVIDTAKYVAHGAANPDEDIWNYVVGKADLTKSLPMGTILTISAAGSETSCSAVITNDEVEPYVKAGMNSDFNRCRFAVMNPEITYTLPKYQLAAGVADIFMHTAERYFSIVLNNHLSDEIAEGLLRDIIKYGVEGYNNPEDYEAMSEIMWCGSVSHVGITGLGSKGDTAKEGDWSCHQLGMAISAIYDSTHGATLTAIWGTWARFVCNENISRFAQYGRKVFGLIELDDAKCSEQAIIKTEEFFKSIDMPTSLSGLLGHMPDQDELIALAYNCSYKKTRSIGAFKNLDYQDMYKIYRLSK